MPSSMTKVLSGTTLLILLAVSSAAAAQTTLKVHNAASHPVDVWVTVGAVAGCAKIADFPFITPAANKMQGSFTLGAGDSQAFPTDKGCLNGNISFGSAPQNCPTPTAPQGMNLAEFNLNQGTETIDISDVAGVNAFIEFQMNGGGAWGTAGHANMTSFSNEDIGQNVGRPGVYPYGCDVCTARQNPPSCTTGKTCQIEAICNVQRTPGTEGGTVTVVFNGFSN